MIQLVTSHLSFLSLVENFIDILNPPFYDKYTVNMDYLFEDSKEDKLIDDYLFGNYKHASKSTSGLDQQFAKPIEDEDLFGFDARLDPDQNDDILDGAAISPNNGNPSQLDLDEVDGPFHGLASDVLFDKNPNSPGDIFEDDEIIGLPELEFNKQDNEQTQIGHIDEIFIDDYSMSPDNRQQQQKSILDINQDTDVSRTIKTFSKTKEPPPPTPEQIKTERMKEKIRESASRMSLKKPQIGAGLGDGTEIEMFVEESKLVSDSNSKLLFGKFFNKSKRADDLHRSPVCDKLTWGAYSQSLRKQICARKRKVWDSFQQPSDGFDEEEELIEATDMDKVDEMGEEEIHDASVGKRIENNFIEDSDDDEDHVRRRPLVTNNHENDGDGNFEDLEREELRSSHKEEEFEDDNMSDIETATHNEKNEDNGESNDGDIDDDDILSDVESSNGIDDKEGSTSADEESGPIEELPDDDYDAVSAQINDCASDSDGNSSDQNFSLNLDEDSSSEDMISAEKRKRRAIFIDDEASED